MSDPPLSPDPRIERVREALASNVNTFSSERWRASCAFLLTRLEALHAEQAQTDLEARLNRRFIERIALCPDHRDKATGICIVCQAEKRTHEEHREARAQWAQKIEQVRALLIDRDDYELLGTPQSIMFNIAIERVLSRLTQESS